MQSEERYGSPIDDMEHLRRLHMARRQAEEQGIRFTEKVEATMTDHFDSDSGVTTFWIADRAFPIGGRLI
jgi:hypothetical protein